MPQLGDHIHREKITLNNLGSYTFVRCRDLALEPLSCLRSSNQSEGLRRQLREAILKFLGLGVDDFFIVIDKRAPLPMRSPA